MADDAGDGKRGADGGRLGLRKLQSGESMWSVFRNRWVKLVLALLCVWGVGYLVYALRSILVPFGLAVVMAYILNPVVDLLHAKLRWPRLAVVLALVGVFTVLLLGAVGLGVYYTVRTVERVVPAAEKALKQTAQPADAGGRVEAALESIPNELRVQIEQAIEQLPETIRKHFKVISASLLKGVGAVFAALLGFVLASFSFVLFFVVTAYVLVDLPALEEGVRDLLPVRYRKTILRITAAIDRDVHAFFRGQILVALALGGIYSVGLLICGVDFALLIGVIAGLANIVPYLGIAVGLTPALLFSLVPYHGPWAPLGVVATFVIGQTIEGFFLTPRIVGKNVGLHPVVVILAIMIFGQLLGFLGIIFAVPLAAAAKVLLGELVRYYKDYQAQMAEADA